MTALDHNVDEVHHNPSAAPVNVRLLFDTTPVVAERGTLLEEVTAGTEVDVRKDGQAIRIRVRRITLNPSIDPPTCLHCSRITEEHRHLILPLFMSMFACLRYMCLGHWVRDYFVQSGRGAARLAIDSYLLAWLALELIGLLLLGVVARGGVFGAIAMLLASYRIIELVIIYLNILLFDRVRSEDTGEAYVIVSSSRSVLISMLSFLELMACFSFIYAYMGASAFSPPGGVSHPLDYLYFSIVIATTLGFGDIAPLGAARAFAAIESVIGVLFAIMIISRMLSWLPEVRGLE